ncbi:MAG TPA: GGDEF domain-containing protein [Burkholderiaceae bacterium]|nr:GGDEF domain-containing protein [Burkholderiaceae bacterium]
MQASSAKYPHTKAESAEYLRLALPLMSRQDAGLHPISYALWYDYVAGTNAALRRSVDEAVLGDARLNEETTLRLFRQHVAGTEDAAMQRVGEGIQRVMNGISDSARRAGSDAENFGAALEGWAQQLGDGATEAVPPQSVQAIVDETRRMQSTMATLKERLDESRAEIETLRKEISRAREEALIDGLTGLANRRAFDRAIGDYAAPPPAAAGGAPVGPSLLMLDIDHFKRVNDTYGHLFGDRVLRSLASVLKANTKGRDIVARYGGEEFAILLRDTPLEGARSLAEELRGLVERSRIRRADSDATLEKITISLGVASFHPGESPADLIRRADAALYASKREGRNRVTVGMC